MEPHRKLLGGPFDGETIELDHPKLWMGLDSREDKAIIAVVAIGLGDGKGCYDYYAYEQRADGQYHFVGRETHGFVSTKEYFAKTKDK